MDTDYVFVINQTVDGNTIMIVPREKIEKTNYLKNATMLFFRILIKLII